MKYIYTFTDANGLYKLDKHADKPIWNIILLNRGDWRVKINCMGPKTYIL